MTWPAMPGCRVVARFAHVHGDGRDSGVLPDWLPRVGMEVRLTPSISGHLVYDPTGAKVIISLAHLVCVVDDDGYLITKADRIPVHIAPTDDPLMSRTGWTWAATWADGGRVNFPAPSTGEVNLADYIVAPPASPVVAEWIDRIPELVAAVGGGGGSSPATVAAVADGIYTITAASTREVAPGIWEV